MIAKRETPPDLELGAGALSCPACTWVPISALRHSQESQSKSQKHDEH
jgi:hypothetical protein